MSTPALSRAALVGLVIVVANSALWFAMLYASSAAQNWMICVFGLAAIAQLVVGIWAVVAGFRQRKAGEKGLTNILVGALVSVGALVGGFLGLGVMALASSGGAWGRPLRVRGKQLHPSLTEGADWTSGPRPDARDLDLATRRALEALWLHDAQKEHASVPAFSRVSWLLAAAGAPAELLVGCHKAATEEIEHTQACFALAAGYGSRTFTVEPMPELLFGGLDGKIDPRITLATESLADGCQLEDFNADVAAACARVCEEPVTRAMLEKIAREERSHAELSWAIVSWLVARHRDLVAAPLEGALAGLDDYARPTAVADEKIALVALADPARLRKHGRLTDAEWQDAWDVRLVETRARLGALLDRPAAKPSIRRVAS